MIDQARRFIEEHNLNIALLEPLIVLLEDVYDAGYNDGSSNGHVGSEYDDGYLDGYEDGYNDGSEPIGCECDKDKVAE